MTEKYGFVYIWFDKKHKRLMAEGIIGMKNRTHSEKTKLKMSESAKNRKIT